jgi:hypothetical protein
MLQRAAVVLIDLFLLAAVAAYALVATAAAPQITIADLAVKPTAGEAAIPHKQTCVIILSVIKRLTLTVTIPDSK